MTGRRSVARVTGVVASDTLWTKQASTLYGSIISLNRVLASGRS